MGQNHPFRLLHLPTFNRTSESIEQMPAVNKSQLGQWPCQIKLVPINAPYFSNAELLIAADCTAYAYANMHNEFMRGKITVIGCPKLDDIDYSEKLTGKTILKALRLSVWKFLAAAVLNMRQKKQSKKAENSYRGKL